MDSHNNFEKGKEFQVIEIMSHVISIWNSIPAIKKYYIRLKEKPKVYSIIISTIFAFNYIISTKILIES